MGDFADAPPSLPSEVLYFPDDAWDSSSPWPGEASPFVTHSGGSNTAHQLFRNDQLLPPFHHHHLLPHQHNIHEPRPSNSTPTFPPPHSSQNTWDEGTSSPQIIPDEIVFPSPSTPSDVSWNVLLSSDSESHAPAMDSQRSRPSRRRRHPHSHITSSQQTSSDFVDLTQDPATPPHSPSPSSASPRGPNKRRRTEPAPPSRTATQRRQLSQQHDNNDVPPDVEEVDLRNIDDDQGLLKVLEDQRMATIKSQQEQASKPVKLATLTCVICMESMADVTATYCGHLFCHKCLMEALIAGENQGSEPGKGPSKCPVCRKKIKRPGTNKRDVGQVVALEIKVKKRYDKGKSAVLRN